MAEPLLSAPGRGGPLLRVGVLLEADDLAVAQVPDVSELGVDPGPVDFMVPL